MSTRGNGHPTHNVCIAVWITSPYTQIDRANHSVTILHPTPNMTCFCCTDSLNSLFVLDQLLINNDQHIPIGDSSIPTSPVAELSLHQSYVIHFRQHHFQRCWTPKLPKPSWFLLFDLYLYFLAPSHFATELPWNVCKWVRIRWQCGIHGRSTTCAIDEKGEEFRCLRKLALFWATNLETHPSQDSMYVYIYTYRYTLYTYIHISYCEYIQYVDIFSISFCIYAQKYETSI